VGHKNTLLVSCTRLVILSENNMNANPRSLGSFPTLFFTKEGTSLARECQSKLQVMLFPKKNSPTETGSSHADAPKSKENNSKKESKVPSITNTDASSTVEAMPELGPYCPISTNKVSSFDSGYDSLSKFDKVMKRPSPHEGKDDETASTKKDSSDSGFNPLEEGRGILGQKIGPPKISARNGKSAIPILVREDYSISTDQDFPPPIKSHILSDEASCISAITFDSSNVEHNNTSDRQPSFPHTKHVYCVSSKRIGGNDCRKEVIDNYRSDYYNSGEGTRRSERVESTHGGKILNLQKENVSLKEMNLQLMMQLSTRRQGSKKQHQYDARQLKDISNKVATSSQLESSELRKVHTELLLKVESTTTTEDYSSDVHDEDSRKLQSLDLFLQLEQQNSQMFNQLQQAELLHTEDLKKIAELQAINTSHQKESIASLEQQLKESNQSAMNLECHLETPMIEELIELKNRQEEEKHELHDAYDKLQLETNLTTELLKRQLPEDRSKSRDGEAARAEGGTDLDSPAKSGERKKLHQDLSLFDLQK
jgi:hypothetical protein